VIARVEYRVFLKWVIAKLSTVSMFSSLCVVKSHPRSISDFILIGNPVSILIRFDFLKM